MNQIHHTRAFLESEAGKEKLDAICMQLIAIGESLKHLDKVTKSSLLHQYPQIDWKKVKGLRDVISHHYFDLNAEAIFDVCENHIDRLAQTIEEIIRTSPEINYLYPGGFKGPAIVIPCWPPSA